MSITPRQKEQISSLFQPQSNEHICPVKDIMATYSDKWSVYVVLLLGKHEEMRFSELRANVYGISQRMLTVTLRSLEEDGIVNRTIYPEMPPRVEYCLTLLGESLLKPLLEMVGWAEENAHEVCSARKKYIKKD